MHLQHCHPTVVGTLFALHTAGYRSELEQLTNTIVAKLWQGRLALIAVTDQNQSELPFADIAVLGPSRPHNVAGLAFLLCVCDIIIRV